MQNAELVLWDLPQGRVRGADDTEHFGDGFERDVGAAISLGHADAAQAATGELFDFCPWQLALLVAAGGLLASGLGKFVGRLQGLCVVTQYFRR
ncbi:hypothetical protein D3C81_1777870 [compost metagenome]